MYFDLPEKANLLLLRMREEEKFVSFFNTIKPLGISESVDLSFNLCTVILFFYFAFFP